VLLRQPEYLLVVEMKREQYARPVSGGEREAWIETEIAAHEAPDPSLLLDVVDPLVHEHLHDEVESWHFFWEPALRLRLRWRDPRRGDALDRRLASLLDLRQGEGLYQAWVETNHGAPGKYTGEADAYGREAWDLIQRDWMNGSELTLRLLRLRRNGRLTGSLASTLEQHWSRHVHLFTNQMFGPSWDYEIDRCLEQARGYLVHSLTWADSPSHRRMLDHVTAALDASSGAARGGG
jgi:hypothetical protein